MERKVTFTDHRDEIKERCGIIEFQAFRVNNNKFIIKELVVLDLETFVIYPFLFKPPFPFNRLNQKWQKTNKWLMRNFHYTDWNEGFTSFKELENIMYHYCNKFTRLYTRGMEKRNLIQLYTSADVINVNIEKTFKLATDNVCILTKNDEHGRFQCAIKNAYRLAAFLCHTSVPSGGGNGEYKTGEEEETRHEYYSRLQREHTFQNGFP
jgi:hypothetical protein